MDNRIANDMISSGMIPSGEKKKEDLGRTQYGSAPSPNALLDAYKSMYDKKEEVINEHHKKDADGNTIPHEHEEELNEGKIPAGLQAYLDKKKGKKEDKKDMKEENVDEAIITGTALLAGKLAAKALAKKALVGATKMAMKKGTTTAATKLIGKGGAKKAAGMVAKKAAVGTGKAMVKNPVNTALAGSMMMPQGGGGGAQPQATQRVAASGKRTAGGLRMDLDLFDVVKGQLLDEGLTEEEILDVMTTLTIDEIQEGLGKVTLGQIAKGVTKTAAVGAGGALAYQGIKKGTKAVDDAINKARDKGFGGNTRPGADKIYFGR